MTGQREYLDNIIQSITDPIFVKDRQHRWVFVNDAFCRFMGYTRQQILGKSDHDYFPKEQADIFRRNEEDVFSSGQEKVHDETITDAKGRQHVVVSKKARYSDREGAQFIVGILRDVTELRLMQQQAAQAQQAEAIAALAGGVAHDMNNQLTPVIGYLDLALHELPSGSAVRPLIEEARQAAMRCSETVERLRDIGRSSPAAQSPTDPKIPKGNELILLADDEESVRRLGRTLLEKLGYQVLLAADGDEALERFRTTKGIALVILDVVMPRMGGQQALQKILETDPAARVLISSGYMMSMRPEDFIHLGAKGFLKKPYLLGPLAQLVRQSIDQRA